jgi:hypothetical protein
VRHAPRSSDPDTEARAPKRALYPSKPVHAYAHSHVPTHARMPTHTRVPTRTCRTRRWQAQRSGTSTQSARVMLLWSVHRPGGWGPTRARASEGFPYLILAGCLAPPPTGWGGTRNLHRPRYYLVQACVRDSAHSRAENAGGRHGNTILVAPVEESRVSGAVWSSLEQSGAGEQSWSTQIQQHNKHATNTASVSQYMCRRITLDELLQDLIP